MNARGLAALAGTAAWICAASPAPLSANPWPGESWPTATPEEMGMDGAVLAQARSYALTGGGAGMIVRFGHVVMSWGNLTHRYELKSSTKSIGAMIVGVGLQDGLFTLDDSAQDHFPGIGVPPNENAATGWLDELTLRGLMRHTNGFDENPGFQPLAYQPEHGWLYSDSGSDWMADVVTLAFDDDLWDVLETRILDVIGVPDDDIFWRLNQYRPQTLSGITRREFGSGIDASSDALARLGYLCLRNGNWNGTQVFPASFCSDMGQTDADLPGLPNQFPGRYPGATSHYGEFWWTNSDGALTGVPTDAFFSWGLFDSVVLVIPSLDIVAVRVGNGWRSGWNANYAVVQPFIGPIAESVDPTFIPEPIRDRTWGALHGGYR